MLEFLTRGVCFAALAAGAVGCGDEPVVVQIGERLDSLAFRSEGDSVLVADRLVVESGDTAQLVVAGYDDEDSSLGAIDVSWMSSDPNVASVSDGVIAALSPGDAEITASAFGVTAVLPVTVVEASDVDVGSGTIYSNEPAGFATVAQTNWSEPLPSGWRLRDDPVDRLAPFNDLGRPLPAPPRGGESVLVVQLDEGVGPGGDHVLAGLPSPGTDTTFVGFHSMFDTNYVNCSFQNKFFYFWLDGEGNGGNPWGWFWLDLHPSFAGATGSGDVEWALRFQGHAWVDANGNSLEQLHEQNQAEQTVVTYGEWDKVEMYYRPPSDPGNIHDGLIEVWHNGVKIIEVTFGFDEGMASGALGGTGKGLDFISTYGGQCAPESDMHFYVADTYVSAPSD